MKLIPKNKFGNKIRKGLNSLDTGDFEVVPYVDRENAYHDQMAEEYANKEEWYYRPLQWWHEAQGSNGWFRNIIPNAVTGTAPDLTPGKGITSAVKGITKALKLAAAARREDVALGVPKKVKTRVKLDRAFNADDARHVNSGLSRVQNAQLKRVADRVKHYPSESHEYDRLLRKLAKATNPEDIKRIKGEIRAFERAFIEKYGHG